MNQQTVPVNHYNTIPQPPLRQFNNFAPPSQPQTQYQETEMYNPQQTTVTQQHQVNQLLRSAQPDLGSGGEFYLHDPQPPQKRTWGQPREPRNHWNTNKYVSRLFFN